MSDKNRPERLAKLAEVGTPEEMAESLTVAAKEIKRLRQRSKDHHAAMRNLRVSCREEMRTKDAEIAILKGQVDRLIEMSDW